MKQKILELRKKIDRIDGILIICLDKRIQTAKLIGDIKKKNNLPIIDKNREKEIFRKVERTKNKENIIRIFERIIEESRKIQNIIKIATLGPEGTCSENAAKNFISKKELNAEIILKDSFQACLTALDKKEADIAIVPSAFEKLNELIFRNLNKIKITESFVLNTPALVIAKNNAKEIKKVACHPAPFILIDNIFPKDKIIFTSSNSISAIKTANKEVDACLTTEIAAKKNNLKLIKNFGEVPMSWNVFERIK